MLNIRISSLDELVKFAFWQKCNKNLKKHACGIITDRTYNDEKYNVTVYVTFIAKTDML